MPAAPAKRPSRRDALAATLRGLERLGSADAIARRLRRLDCRGKPGSPFTCPLARYLRRQHPGLRSLIVACTHVSFRGSLTSLPLGRFALAFRRRFDDDRYPALDAAN